MVSRRLLKSRIRLAVLSVCGGLAIGCAAFAQDEAATGDAQPVTIKQVLEQGEQLLGEEKYAEVLTLMGAAIGRGATYDPRPYLIRAKARFALEEYDSALDDTRDTQTYATGLPQLIAEAQKLEGQIYLEQGSADQAIQSLQAAAGALRDDPELQFTLGKAQVLGGLAEVGVETLTKYLGLEDPDFADREAEVFRLRAQASAGLRRFDEAQDDLDRAIEIDATDHENYLTRARIYMIEEDYANAAVAFEQVIDNYTPEDERDELPPIQAHLSRAVALEEVGLAATTPEETSAAFTAVKAESERLLGLLPDRPELAQYKANAKFRLGIANRQLGDFPAAIRALSEAIDLLPQGAPALIGQAYYRRGICFFYQGEEQLALLDFEQAAGLLETDPRANFWAGRTHTKLGDYLSALRFYGKAIAVSDRYTDAFVHRGLAYYSLEEYDKAIVDFNEAIRLQPAAGRPYYYRGVAYDLLGDNDKAITSLSNAIQFDPELVVAHRYLARKLRETGNGSLAEQYEQRAREIEARKAQ